MERSVKAILQPLLFRGRNEREAGECDEQLGIIYGLYGKVAEFKEPIFTDELTGDEAVDGYVFPQLIGDAFRDKKIGLIKKPVLVLTAEFGTVLMWDWEIVNYMKEKLHLTVFAPYSTEMAEVVMRAMAASRNMKLDSTYLIFQNTPGEGKQAYIFKKFYWWEKECIENIESVFGVKFVFKDWKLLNIQAAKISDSEAEKVWDGLKVPVSDGVKKEQLLSAVKLYIAMKNEIDKIGNVWGIGANCLNESFYSNTVPCLAYNWLFEKYGIMWACEGDLLSLVSMTIFCKALNKPLMMTNLYPFLMGMAALKHEKITSFPDISEPDNCSLGVHCGYYGFAPQSFCEEWTVRPKVLEIVDDNAVAVDCRFKKGPVTLAKIHTNMCEITAISATLEDYAQYPGSDCRNGAIFRFNSGDGSKIVTNLVSHHMVVIQGDVIPELREMAEVYGLKLRVY